MAQQFNFVVIVRREVCVPAFRRHRLIARTVPEEDGLAQSGSRSNQGERLVVLWRSAGVEDFEFVRSEQQNTVRHGFEIVEQLHSRYVELFRQRCAIDHPREVGRLRMVLKDGAGDAETSRIDFRRCFR